MNDVIRFLLDYLANYALPFRVTVGFITMALIIAVIAYQARETIKFRGDFVSHFRWGLLTLQTLILMSMVPTQTYIFCRMIGIENENLRNLSTLFGGFAPFAFTIAFIVLYVIVEVNTRRKQ